MDGLFIDHCVFRWYDRKQLLGIGKLMEEESREGGKDAEEQEEDKYGHPPVDLAFLLD